MEYLFMFSGLGFLLLCVAIVVHISSRDYQREVQDRREFGIPMSREKEPKKKHPAKQ